MFVRSHQVKTRQAEELTEGKGNIEWVVEETVIESRDESCDVMNMFSVFCFEYVCAYRKQPLFLF